MKTTSINNWTVIGSIIVICVSIVCCVFLGNKALETNTNYALERQKVVEEAKTERTKERWGSIPFFRSKKN